MKSLMLYRNSVKDRPVGNTDVMSDSPETGAGCRGSISSTATVNTLLSHSEESLSGFF
jgi:hypothetical protein